MNNTFCKTIDDSFARVCVRTHTLRPCHNCSNQQINTLCERTHARISLSYTLRHIERMKERERERDVLASSAHFSFSLLLPIILHFLGIIYDQSPSFPLHINEIFCSVVLVTLQIHSVFPLARSVFATKCYFNYPLSDILSISDLIFIVVFILLRSVFFCLHSF